MNEASKIEWGTSGARWDDVDSTFITSEPERMSPSMADVISKLIHLDAKVYFTARISKASVIIHW